MRAVTYHQYGAPDVLKLEDVAKPVPKNDEVLVKIHTVSLNASDFELLTGKPLYTRIFGLFSPRRSILGSDIAGTVEAVGSNVKAFNPGDAVFGDIFDHMGGLADYASVPESVLTHKPAGMTFVEAAAAPQAGTIALQAIRDKGNLQPGQTVLINGAGGGAGTFAVQIAKMLGAEVTGVDSAAKLSTLETLGADHVIDYTRQDFTRDQKQYDLIIDLVATRSVFDCRRAMRPSGTYLLVGGKMSAILQVASLGTARTMFTKQTIGILAVQQNRQHLNEVADLIVEGRISPVIDRTYTLSEAPVALKSLGGGRALGKLVITIDDNR